MFFYEDLVKKIEKKEIELKESYSFGLNLRKKAVWLFTGIPLLLMGIFQMYLYFNLNEGGIALLVFSAFIIFLGVYNLKMAYEYNLKLNLKNKYLKNRKLDINLEDVEEIELSRIVPPGSKRLEACISIITKDKKQIIIPLMMKDRVLFVSVLRKYFGDKFTIVREKD